MRSHSDRRFLRQNHPANGGTIGDAAAEYEGKCVTNRKAGLQIIRGKWNLGVKGENFDVLFSYNSCGLVSYRYMGKELIEKIPMPNFWRAPIDNDAEAACRGGWRSGRSRVCMPA